MITITKTNPCTLVRQSCFAHVQNEDHQCQKHVIIQTDRIPILAQDILQKKQQQVSSSNHPDALLVEWDEENWHYSCASSKSSPSFPSLKHDHHSDESVVVVVDTTTWPLTLQMERMALYILALDAINFCFWQPIVVVGNDTNTTSDANHKSHQCSTYKYEYEDLAQTLTNMARSDHVYQQEQINLFHHATGTDPISTSSTSLSKHLVSSQYLLSPMNLQNMTLDRMIQLFEKYHPNNYNNHSSLNNGDHDSSSQQPVQQQSYYVPPHMKERCQIWNEIGTVLMNPPFCGSILPLFEMVQETYQKQPSTSSSNSPSSSEASIMVQLLIDYFPNFRDDTKQRYDEYMSKQQQQEESILSNASNQTTSESLSTPASSVSSKPPPPSLYFYKRAQICVGDLYAALTSAKLLQNDDSANNNNMDDITTFADYRVPQLLRHCKILQYSTKLAQQIDTFQELIQHSEEEYAIRASTIVAVELLVQELRHQQSALLIPLESNNNDDTRTATATSAGSSSSSSSSSSVRWNAMQTDWYLWQLGEKMEQKNELQPHHRVRTTFY
jgi:hypothetical protein